MRTRIAALFVLVLIGICAGAQSIRVETALATLTLNSTTCDLTGVSWKKPALNVIGDSRLGENFRILVPAHAYEANYFFSREQKAVRIEQNAQGVVCHYASLTNARETLPIAVTYTMRVEEGQLRFSIDIENPTERKLAEVYYGVLGGLQGAGNRTDTKTMVPAPSANLAPALFTHFHESARGGTRFGARYEVRGYTYPGEMPMGWMDAYNTTQNVGYYYGNQDTDTRLASLYFEMRPYTKGVTLGDDWPRDSELPSGEPRGLTMGWLNFPYTSKGHFHAGPVALQVHSGDWHAASHIYRTWFDQHFNVKRAPTWLRKENAWQSIILSGPEDVVAHRFNELPKLAADAKKYGITTFEILGWDIGGLDRGYPLYTPDPRLGTRAEFHDALAKMRSIGVHPLVFSNVQEVDTALPIFKERFAKYAVQRRFAPDWSMEGWGEGTMSARLGLTQSNMTMVSPTHPEFRDYLMKQWMDIVRDGADALQLDKTHTSVLDFNPLLRTSPDKSIEAATVEVFHDMLAQARTIKPDLALAAENWHDRAFSYVDVSYMRENNVDMNTALRYTFPEWTSTIFAEQPDDINLMNNGMRYGLVWDVAARHYNESVDESLMRPLMQYVSELIRIRKQYADLLFLGRFNDTMGATVTGGKNTRFSVFKAMNEQSKDSAVVVVNFAETSEETTVSIDGAEGRTVTISAPFEKDRTTTLPTRITLPANHCAVVILRNAH